MTSTPPVARPVAAIECDLLAQATFRASPAEILTLRKQPGALGERTIPASMLRHADEQTVVGLAAVLLAILSGGLDPAGFGGWAVLAAPRFLGRAAFERAFPTFLDEGVWGVSPHLIPAHSLHSPSGTISQAIQAHGPNLGVGGTPGGEREALLFGATLLATGSTPGVWVVLSGRHGERDGVEPSGDYEALALALTQGSLSAALDRPRLLVSPGQVRPLGPVESSIALAEWLAPGTLRADRGSIPAPHFTLSRSESPRESRHDRK